MYLFKIWEYHNRLSIFQIFTWVPFRDYNVGDTAMRSPLSSKFLHFFHFWLKEIHFLLMNSKKNSERLGNHERKFQLCNLFIFNLKTTFKIMKYQNILCFSRFLIGFCIEVIILRLLLRESQWTLDSATFIHICSI